MLPGGLLRGFDMRLLNWAQLALSTPVVAWAGWPFFQRAWQSVVFRSPNMFTLIALGVGAAYLYSLAATLAPWAFPAGFRTAHGAVEPYFDTKTPDFIAHESGARVVVLYPSVGGVPEIGDYFALFDHDLRLLAEALGGAR